MNFKLTAVVAVAVLGLVLIFASTYTVSETEQVIITQFGQPIGAPVTEAGLHFKTPFVQTVNRIEKRILEWDGDVTEMPTKDKLYISIDTFARWRIKDAQIYFIRIHDERSAISRISDILGSETRNTVAAHNLVELVRTDKDRKPVVDPTMGESALSAGLQSISYGRVTLENEIFKTSAPKLVEYGIELLDMRIKRVTYNSAVANKIFQRMVSERQQIAARYRAEGEGEAAKILGQRERDLQQVESEAYRKVQAIMGKADADASAIYAAAYNQDSRAREFQAFTRSLETYRTSFARGTTLILTTDDGFLRFLKGDIATKPAESTTTQRPPATPPATTPILPPQ